MSVSFAKIQHFKKVIEEYRCIIKLMRLEFKVAIK